MNWSDHWKALLHLTSSSVTDVPPSSTWNEIPAIEGEHV